MTLPFRITPHCESGVVMSQLFPNQARCADDHCVIRSVHADTPNQAPGVA
jgi:hypothetical protein